MIATGTAILAASAVGAGAAIYGSNKATNAAKDAAAKNAQTIASTQEANNELLKPYVQGGLQAQDAIQAFLGLKGSGQQDEAFTKWRESTGYKFGFDQGIDAINSNRATAGLLKSGSTLKAAMQFGRDYGDQQGSGRYLNALMGQQQSGLTAAGQNVNANSNSASMTLGNNNALAGAIGQGAYNTSNAIGNMASDAMKFYSLQNTASGRSTGSSYGGSSGSNALYSNDKWMAPQRSGSWA